jgi:cellulose synthase (UDP-forming)
MAPNNKMSKSTRTQEEQIPHSLAATANPVHEGMTRGQTLVVLAYLIAAGFYLGWRPTTFNPDAPVFSAIVYGAEVFGLLAALMHLFMVWRLTVRVPPAVAPGLAVDVFITTYNEPVDMVHRTLSAAMRIRYPHQTWLLDDGNRPEMCALAVQVGANYLARTRNTGAKAGNLNNALAHAKGEFVAVFDADHAPLPEFLDRMLGYFADSKVAFVSSPQDFYNLDSFQHPNGTQGRQVWNEQSLFFRVIQRGKDYWNSAFFCGTCGVLRRRALEDIGLFSTDTITEDLDTSIKIHRKGWKSVYHAESLAFGVAPNDLVPFLRQRLRWGQGAMQVLKRQGFVLFARGLSLPQRINYFASIFMYFDGWPKVVLYFAPAIVLLTGLLPVVNVSWEFLARFIPYYILTFWVFEEAGRGYGHSVQVERYNMSRFAIFAWSTFGLFRKKLRFQVTDKSTDSTGASAQARRILLPQRVVLLANLCAIVLGTVLFLTLDWISTGVFVSNVLWAVVNLALAVSVIGLARRGWEFKRREYRFPVPLSATITLADGTKVSGVMDDVSHMGFRFYGPFPDTLRQGTILAGEIRLPWGYQNFDFTIHRLNKDASGAARSLGCGIQWREKGGKDQLEKVLFGSGLQWVMNDLTERIRTPLQKIRMWMSPRQARQDNLRWAPAQYRNLRDRGGDHHDGLVSVSVPGAERYLTSYAPVLPEDEIALSVSGRAGVSEVRGFVTLKTTVAVGGHEIFLYRFRVTAEGVSRTRYEPPVEAGAVEIRFDALSGAISFTQGAVAKAHQGRS